MIQERDACLPHVLGDPVFRSVTADLAGKLSYFARAGVRHLHNIASSFSIIIHLGAQIKHYRDLSPRLLLSQRLLIPA